MPTLVLSKLIEGSEPYRFLFGSKFLLKHKCGLEIEKKPARNVNTELGHFSADPSYCST